MGSRVRLGLNVGASEREITEEVGFEVLFSSLTDSVVDVLITLVISKEGETTNTKKKKKEKKGETFYEEREAQQLRHKVVSINTSSQMAVFTCSSIVGTDMYKTTAKQNKNEPGIHADLENRETHEMKSCIIIIMSK